MQEGRAKLAKELTQLTRSEKARWRRELQASASAAPAATATTRPPLVTRPVGKSKWKWCNSMGYEPLNLLLLISENMTFTHISTTIFLLLLPLLRAETLFLFRLQNKASFIRSILFGLLLKLNLFLVIRYTFQLS